MDEPPAGYAPPVIVYLVEEINAAGEIGQVGGFFTEEEAGILVQRLAADGRQAYINMVGIHRRAVDHEYDQ